MTDAGGVAAQSPARQSWLILAAAFTAFTIGAGLMHSYAVYLVAFIEEFGWSRAETSLAYSVSQLVAGSARRLSGRWSTGWGRAGCCCCSAAGFWCWACSAAPLS